MLVLIVKDENDKKKKWAYSVFLELDTKELLQRHKEKTDIDRISQIFYGLSIGPAEKVITNPHFTPFYEVDNKIISNESLKPGSYTIQVFGFSADGERILRTSQKKLKISSKNLIETFSGSESGVYLNTDLAIKSSLGKHNYT